jgi:hypothetical protein
MPLTIYTGGGERMRLDTSGNLGIGGTPTVKWQVFDTNKVTNNPGNAAIYTTTAQGADVGGQLSLGGLYTASDYAPFAAIAGRKSDGTSGNTNGYMALSVLSSGTITERMRIDSSGNVMVGVTSTNAKLEVAGIIKDAAGDVRSVPQSGSNKTTTYTVSAGDNGRFIGVGTSGKIVIPNAVMAAGNVISLYNATTGNVTVECSISIAYIAGTNTDKASVTLATRGVATVLFLDSDNCVITGNVT